MADEGEPTESTSASDDREAGDSADTAPRQRLDRAVLPLARLIDYQIAREHANHLAAEEEVD